MELPGWATTWPLVRQLVGPDSAGRAAAAQSRRSFELTPRTADADKVVKSICPYCAVGFGQDAYVKDGKVVQIEGDPDSPVSRGRLCPKGSASKQLVTSPGRVQTVKYRRPHGTEWEDLPLETAAYLFLGGLAGGSSLLAAGADLTGRPALRRASRLTALAAITSSFAALVHDLGRPARFHHMLRVAKLSSPMSVGTWILTAYGPMVGLAALPELRAVLPRVMRGKRCHLLPAVRACSPRASHRPSPRTPPYCSATPPLPRGAKRVATCRSCSSAARPQQPAGQRCS